MRHYELVLVIHPDQSEQVRGMVERYSGMINDMGGRIHRTEDWGRLHLAYTIGNIHKAHYLLINCELPPDAVTKLKTNLRFNDAILRHLLMSKKEAETGKSFILKKIEAEDDKVQTAETATDETNKDNNRQEKGEAE